jgi:hypothetical protein
LQTEFKKFFVRFFIHARITSRLERNENDDYRDIVGGISRPDAGKYALSRCRLTCRKKILSI